MSEKNKRGSNPYIALMKIAWKYAYGERKRYVLVYFFFMMSNILDAINPIIWGLFINELQKQGTGILKSSWIYVGIYLLIRFLDWCFHGPARVMERKLAFRIGKNYLQEMYNMALHLPVKWHQDNHSGATINRIRKAYDALREFFENGFMYFHSLAKFVFSFGAMIYFAPLFGMVGTVMGIGTILVILKFDKPFIAAVKQVNEKEHVVYSTLFDSLSNIITVITLRLEKRMESGIIKRVMDIFPPFKRKITINEWKWFTVEMLVGLIYCVILIGYVYQNWVPGEVFLIGGLVTVMAYVNKFTSVFHNIAWQYTAIVEHHTDILTAQGIVDAYQEFKKQEGIPKLTASWEKVQINSLNFSHKEESEKGEFIQGLSNLKINFSKGKKIALIGESGSGKSTLLAILRGLYNAEPGVSICIDDQNYDQLGVISECVTLFPQEPEIFENTIEYNITLGLPFGKKEIETVCDIVHFSEVITQLPKGLESSIQEKGVNLSGGQKQRLALARGVFAAKDSDIILLDEPTSSVDPKTELLIYDKLFDAFSDKAIISALHRLHLLTKFDYVYVLENGKVVDEGTFEKLKADSPIFQELWRHQEEHFSYS